MEAFSALLALSVGNSPVTGEFPSQRPVTRSFHVFFNLRLNKRLSKQSRRWSFEKQSRSLWRHFNVLLCCRVASTTHVLTDHRHIDKNGHWNSFETKFLVKYHESYNATAEPNTIMMHNNSYRQISWRNAIYQHHPTNPCVHIVFEYLVPIIFVALMFWIFFT